MNSVAIPLDAVEAYGESTARSLPVTGTVAAEAGEAAVRSGLRALARAHGALQKRQAGAGGEPAPEAAQWLLDNWYLAQREGLDACAAFRRAGRIRDTAEGALVLALCRALLVSGGGGADEERCLLFLGGFQKKIVLTRRELTLFPAGLRGAALLELAEEYGRPSPDPLRVGALFGALRLWGALDLAAVLERADRTEQILREDPAGIYPRMDEKTRALYRLQTEKLARRRGIPEYRAAQRAVRLARSAREGEARHVGYYLFTMPLGEPAPRRRGGGYIAANVLGSLSLALLLGYALRDLRAAALLLLPLSQLVKSAVDLFVLRLTPPRPLPRLELAEGVPAEGRTLCVVSVLLTGGGAAGDAARRLEEYRLASRDCGENLLFGLLCDLPEAEQPQTEADRPLLARAAEAVDALNRKYGGGFYLLTRDRVLSRDTGRFAGWERKRGAVLELARLLAGESSSLRAECGSLLGLRGVRYILTLDGDTRLEPESARRLIGAALHPLNRPVVDRRRGIVTAGHGVIQPRIGVDLSGASASDFTRLFAGQGGTDPYGGDAGEVYMDLLESGGFAGKGILDVRAFLDCLDGRLPEGRVLSHDALEGAFLRGGYMGDTELTDGFPSGPLSYYRRQHRWVRGDWQNLPWLLRRGRALPPIERWRLFDSLRRSLVPPATLAALLAGVFWPRPALVWTAGIALFTLLSHLLFTLLRDALRPEEEVRLRLLSGVLHGGAAGLTEALLRLLLPFEAWVDLSAACTALWRMLISHKNLLAWQTAAQSEARAASGLAAHYRQMWFAVLTGLCCVSLAPAVLGKAAGIFWLLSPLCACTLGKPGAGKTPLRPEDRDWLLRRAAEIWRYFETFCGPEDHFLPPDNFQDSPPLGLAHRTSPTNIGLALLSALCALDLGLTGRDKALGLAENLLAAMERLPKWQGHLYNWYDTRTLRSLQPAYVSTVDSGNLWACLLTAAQGLREHGGEALAARADALRLAMDFRPLYDGTRKLFRIGLAPGDEAPARSWYDLLESEARLAGYIAVASGQAPRAHWRHLSRAQVACDGFRGMASWSGTMFEYLMPELFLPLYRNSLLDESARFALYVQKKRRGGAAGVWGTSESAYAALDAALSYRYKAHGCARLALRRGMDEELVVSPYSSFLALTVNEGAALKNLRALEGLELLGPYGFWEAVDFTPSRCPGGAGVPVRCVMSHHLGMSLAAITNALLDGLLPRRFMADPAMNAYRGLLQEKIPLGGLLLRRREVQIPALPRPGAGAHPAREGQGTDFVRPACTVLSNGVYSLVFSESGMSRARCGAVIPYRVPARPLADGQGLSLYWRQAGEAVSLLPLPGRGGSFVWRLSAGEGALSGRRGNAAWTVSALVSRRGPGELRRITLRRAPGSGPAELLLLLEPVLLPEKDYVNHPSWARLGLRTEVRDGVLLARRLRRGKQPALTLALACSRPAEFSSDARQFPGRGGLPERFPPNAGWQSEPLLSARVVLDPGETEAAVVFALAVAADAEAAMAAARRILAETEGFRMAEASAALLGMGESGAAAAMEMLPALVFPALCRQAADGLPGVGREALWRLGISGDLPIVCAECAGADGVPAGTELLRRHALLSASGIPFDLVFLTDDGGDYHRPRRSALESALRRLDRDACVGARGGVHFASLAGDRAALAGSAALFFGSDGLCPTPERRTDRSCIPLPSAARTGEPPAFGWDEDGAFRFAVRGTLPPRSWGNMLTNGVLGAFAADAGTGSLWYRNARECPLIPWTGDPLAVSGPERLWAEAGGESRSLFAAPGDPDCRVLFDFGTAVWEKSVGGAAVRVTAFVPPEGASRVFLLESSGPCRVSWCAPLQLAPEPEDASACSVTLENGVFRAQNPRCPFPGVTFSARCSQPWTSTGTDARLWLAGESSRTTRSAEPCFAGSFALDREAVLICGTEAAETPAEPDSARRALRETRAWWRERVTRLQAETPVAELNRLLNGWCQYQALACRILGRSSPYQSGGAIGFRDQLQDYVNLIPLDPAGCRAHILVCCAHQFEEGDVQHWWHPGTGRTDKGVRTRCSDDLLWLPWALCEYAEATGDLALVRAEAPYLFSPPLAEEAASRYETPELSGGRGTVLDHCRRALRLVLARGAGAHGLLRMGSGDWNDSFDGMGPGAESTWLTWFFSLTAGRFGALLARLGEPDGEKYEKAAAALGRAADAAWDGDRYLRGYYGDGEPLGAGSGEECRIDSVAQSFAAFCPYTDPQRADAALDTALRELWDRENHLIRLYTPPFGGDARSPGYAAAYGPGFRENGGQYTHAALWLAMACLRRGRREEGAALLRDAGAGFRAVPVYGAEPFVVPADIAAGEQAGRAGWSWYTGSAGWFFRAAYRELLGLSLREGRPVLEPRIPPSWPGYTGRFTAPDGREYAFGVQDGRPFLR